MEENRQPMKMPLEEIETTPVDEPMEECKTAPIGQRNSTNGLVVGIAAGMIAGILIGFLLRQMPVWIVGGILLGGAIGCLLDLRRDRRRKEAYSFAAVAAEEQEK